MTDEELAQGLGLTPAEAAILLPRLAAQERAMYERLLELGNKLDLWQAGLGPKPVDVIMCRDRKGR
jgi:hypothetical protein